MFNKEPSLGFGVHGEVVVSLTLALLEQLRHDELFDDRLEPVIILLAALRDDLERCRIIHRHRATQGEGGELLNEGLAETVEVLHEQALEFLLLHQTWLQF